MKDWGINKSYQEIGLEHCTKEDSWVKNYESIRNQVMLAEH